LPPPCGQSKSSHAVAAPADRARIGTENVRVVFFKGIVLSIGEVIRLSETAIYKPIALTLY
jgi:hypothetical protein